MRPFTKIVNRVISYEPIEKWLLSPVSLQASLPKVIAAFPEENGPTFGDKEKLLQADLAPSINWGWGLGLLERGLGLM